MLLQEQKRVNEPVLPRKRKAPAQFEVGSHIGHQPNTPKYLYRQDYFECLDFSVACIRDWFKQPGLGVLNNLEDLLLKATRNENYDTELDFVLDFYKDDYQPSHQRHSWNFLQQPLAQVRRNQRSWKYGITSNFFHQPNEIASQKSA